MFKLVKKKDIGSLFINHSLYLYQSITLRKSQVWFAITVTYLAYVKYRSYKHTNKTLIKYYPIASKKKVHFNLTYQNGYINFPLNQKYNFIMISDY